MKLLIENLIDRFREWQRNREDGQFFQQLRAIERTKTEAAAPSHLLNFSQRKQS